MIGPAKSKAFGSGERAIAALKIPRTKVIKKMHTRVCPSNLKIIMSPHSFNADCQHRRAVLRKGADLCFGAGWHLAKLASWQDWQGGKLIATISSMLGAHGEGASLKAYLRGLNQSLAEEQQRFGSD